ncbi:MAG TPA: hypothetical protein VNA89_15490 [Gemmatimonadaceae bacterium]|nr:hypothetical protein [Gemmatimonadaceae bacterium]
MPDRETERPERVQSPLRATREAISAFAFHRVDGPVRVFHDSDGMRWRAYERQHDDQPHPSLIFESVVAVRRVRDYPDSWHELSDAELGRLSWER